MPMIKIYQEKVTKHDDLIKLCPFDAIETSETGIQINSACKMCKICVKKEPEIFEFIEFEQAESLAAKRPEGEHDTGRAL